LVWVLVLGLWAHITYQFVMEEGPVPEQRMHWLGNPFPRQSLPKPSLEDGDASAFSSQMKAAPPAGNFIKPIPPAVAPPTRRAPARTATGSGSVRRHEYGSLPSETQVPERFFKVKTLHFVVLSEGEAPRQSFLETLENLHGNLMLDLAAFSPWANDEQVTVYVFRTQDMYRQVTKRPAWS